MKITYRFRCDADYMKTVIDRQYQQGPFLLRLPVQFGILGFVCASMIIWLEDVSLGNSVALLFVILLPTIAYGVFGTKRGLLRRLSRQADFGAEVTVTLSEDGLAVVGPNVQMNLEWPAYPRSVRFGDGILLQKSGAVRWLPDSGILDGTATEAISLVESKSALRRIA